MRNDWSPWCELELNQDGTLRGTPRLVSQTGITDTNRPQASVHAERAIRAVRLAAPFNLPTQFYSDWDDVAVDIRSKALTHASNCCSVC